MLTHGAPQRWVIDFQKRDLFEARSYPAPFEHLRVRVLPRVTKLAENEKAKTGKSTGQDQQWLKTWWQHFRCRRELIDRIAALPRYMACCEVTKRPIFCFIDSGIRPDHTLEAFVFADDYSFGIIQSDPHWHWFQAKCSKLKGNFRYTPRTVFDTFPWPQAPTREQIAEVAAAAVALRALRQEIMGRLNYSLRALYRTLDDPGTNPLRTTQARLDTAVRAAYAMPKDAAPLAFLLALNLELAAKEKSGDSITPPGLPLLEEECAAFLTDDCLRAAVRRERQQPARGRTFLADSPSMLRLEWYFLRLHFVRLSRHDDDHLQSSGGSRGAARCGRAAGAALEVGRAARGIGDPAQGQARQGSGDRV